MAKAPKDKAPKAEAAQDAPAAKPAPAKPARERGGWLAKFAPGVRSLADRSPKRETPDNLWVKDPDTGEMIYRPDLEAALWVTPSGRHMRIGPKLRFAYIFDDGAYGELPTPGVVEDPLSFVDDRPYAERLRTARKATGKAAVARQAPLVAFTAAGGARMQEGALSLMQMARTTLAIQELKAARLPYIVVLTDPTTGGVTASYAMLGDVHLAEPGALIGFAGPRVIEQTIRETLPPGFQRSEYLVEKGMVDKVVPRSELPRVLGQVLSTLMAGRAGLAAAE